MNTNTLEWIIQIFTSKTAQNGGVVKRKIASVEKHASENQLVREAKSRGCHVLKSDTHYLVFCSNPFHLKQVC